MLAVAKAARSKRNYPLEQKQKSAKKITRRREGTLPRRAQQLVLDWAELHKEELLEDWQLCMTKKQPNKIAPLK
jgi:RNase adaptor protein for sRNA GlmZ degradation